MLLNKRLMNNLEILSNKNNLAIDVNKNTDKSLIITDYTGSEITINCKENSHTTLLYFSKKEEIIKLNAKMLADSMLKIDFILMNDNIDDSIEVELNGENTECNIRVLSLAKNAKKDIHINVIHNAKYSTSFVSNYGISFENGVNNFIVSGKINSEMKDSDVRQITKGLILDPTGRCEAKPILLIDYYDVKAYHGATIGKISDDDLFYLMSRGLSKKEAFMLVINGILEPFIKNITEEKIKNEIMFKYQDYFKGE